ncbi:hypothetical protein QYF36_012195 [Acer negundo]|nr:hypothetical protein QYF36_012195 [Acer negundo]
MHLEMVGESTTPKLYAKKEAISPLLKDFDMGPHVGYRYMLFDSEVDDGEQPVDVRLVFILASSPIEGDNSARLPEDAPAEQNKDFTSLLLMTVQVVLARGLGTISALLRKEAKKGAKDYEKLDTVGTNPRGKQ